MKVNVKTKHTTLHSVTVCGRCLGIGQIKHRTIEGKIEACPCCQKGVEDEVELEFQTTFEPAFGDIQIQRQLDDNDRVIGYVVGYLVEDTDAESPFDMGDSEGSIFSSRRSDTRESHEGFQKALGLDSNWHRVGPGDPLAVPLDVYDHSGICYAISGSVEARCFPDQRWDVAHGGAVWVPNEGALENIECTAWHDMIASQFPDVKVEYKTTLKPDGTCFTRPCKPGETGYFKNEDGSDAGTVPDERYNNVITLTLPSGLTCSGYKSFTSAYRAAARRLGRKWPKSELNVYKRKAAVEYAKSVIEEYNRWLAGDCWGVCVDSYDADCELVHDQACWGFIGRKYAAEELEREMNYACEQLRVRCNAQPSVG